METKRDDLRQPAAREPKKQYVTPVVEVHGTVQEITRSGKGAGLEFLQTGSSL